VRGEWFVATALMAAVLWIVGDAIGLHAAVAAAIAFAGAFAFRVAALYLGWEEPLATVPKGVRVHDDRRPLLGRKLHHKSAEELRVLGLAVDESDGP